MRRIALLPATLALAGCVAPVARERPTQAVAPPAAEAPPPLRPLATLIAQDPALSRFRALAAAGDLAALVAGHGPATILAPTDAAFARLPAGTVAALLLPGNRPSLRHLLRFWIVVDGIVHPGTGGPLRLPTQDEEQVTVITDTDRTVVIDAAGRRSAVDARPATDGTLALLDGVIAPRSIEPGH